MPVHSCMKNGKPGYKWGKSGKCYTYMANNKKARDRAKKKALAQARAIFSKGYRE